MSRLLRKRLAWIVALIGFPFNAVLGDRHWERFSGHPWKQDPADRADRAIRRARAHGRER